MSEKLTKLAERRAALVAKSAQQREAMAHAAGAWRKPMNFADRGISVLSHLARHPLLVTAAVALVTALRPRLFLRWSQRGWLLWRIIRGARKLAR